MKSAITFPSRCLSYVLGLLYRPFPEVVLDTQGEGPSFTGFDSDVNPMTELSSMIFYSEDTQYYPLFSMFSIAGAMFGAVHCLAWGFSFPSHVEKIMWIFASLGIVGSCTAALYGSIFSSVGDAEGSWEAIFVGLMAIVGLIAMGLAFFVYPVARIILLVIAVTTLRSLPPSAFATVDWVELIPHI